MKTICIAGKNDIAVDVMLYCKDNYPQNRIVVITNRNESGKNSWQKSLKWFAEKNDIEIVQLDDVYSIEDMLFLSTEFDRIIRPERFKTTELYNIHFSLLPKYKGCFTAIMPILNGEKYTGVTLHRIRKGIDTGEIVEQKLIDIDEKDCSLDVYRKCIQHGTELIIKNIDILLSGRMNTTPQDKEGSTYYPNTAINFSKLELDVNATAYQIRNQIRAFAFRPYQLLTWNGTRYFECKITDDVSEDKQGTILEDTDVYTRISTIDYDVILYKDTFEDILECIKKHDNDRVKQLCVSKKLLEAQDEHGWSLLTVAVYNDNFEIVKWLCNNGADMTVLNNNGTNLLMYAKNCFVNTCDASIFEYLANQGLAFDEKDYLGKTLYDYCKEEKIRKIGKYDIVYDVRT